MKVTFIGTGSGSVSLNRYHSSLLFSSGSYNLLVDAGDGISRALLNAKVDYNSVSGILFTHLHPDHFSGLGLLIVQMNMKGRREPLEIFLHKDQVEIVKEYLLASNLLPEKINFEIQYRSFESNGEFLTGGTLKVLPRENSHLAELREFPKYSRRNFFSGSFLFSHAEKNLMYTGDIGLKDDLMLFREFDLHILISEITHLGLTDMLEIFELLNPVKIYLTHITEGELPKIKNHLNRISNFPANIIFAEDGQIIQF